MHTKLNCKPNKRSLLHRENFDFLSAPIFWKYSNGPGIVKKCHMSKMTRMGPRICLKVLVSKFDQKILKGSVQIANCNLSRMILLGGLTPKNMPQKLQTPHHHPLNKWLLRATNGNNGQTVTWFWSSDTIRHGSTSLRSGNIGGNVGAM